MGLLDPIPQFGSARQGPSRPHVIVFANEKGGVGKSTLAFHTCVALANRSESVFAIDLDRRQQSLGHALDSREGTTRRLKGKFPRLRCSVLDLMTESGLQQEINRLGSECAFVVIDVAGHDSAIARVAMERADTLVTPMNESLVDLDLLGRLDPVSANVRQLGHFSRLIGELRSNGGFHGNWFVVPNRLRQPATASRQKISSALSQIAPLAGFQILPGICERVIYRDLYALGLTLFDLEYIPGLAKPQPVARLEIETMLDQMALPTASLVMREFANPA